MWSIFNPYYAYYFVLQLVFNPEQEHLLSFIWPFIGISPSAEMNNWDIIRDLILIYKAIDNQKHLFNKVEVIAYKGFNCLGQNGLKHRLRKQPGFTHFCTIWSKVLRLTLCLSFPSYKMKVNQRHQVIMWCLRDPEDVGRLIRWEGLLPPNVHTVSWGWERA